jgi:hypothetical protein
MVVMDMMGECVSEGVSLCLCVSLLRPRPPVMESSYEALSPSAFKKTPH